MKFIAYPERFYKVAKFAASLLEKGKLGSMSLGALYDEAKKHGVIDRTEGGPYAWDYRIYYMLKANPTEVYSYLGQYPRENDLGRGVDDIWTEGMVEAIQKLSGHRTYTPRLEEDYDKVLEIIGATARKTGRYSFSLYLDMEELHGCTIPYTTMMEIVYRTILVSQFIKPRFYEGYKDVVQKFISFITDSYTLPQRWGARETGIPKIPLRVKVAPVAPPERGRPGESKYTFNQFLSSLYSDLLSKFKNGLEYDTVSKLLRLPEFYRKSSLYASNATAIQGLLNPEEEYRDYFPGEPETILDIGCGPITFFECAEKSGYGVKAVKSYIDLSSVLDYLEPRFELANRSESSPESVPLRMDGQLFGLFPDGFSEKELKRKGIKYDLVVSVSFLDQMMPVTRLYTSLLLIASSLSQGGVLLVLEPHDLRKRIGKEGGFEVSLDEYVFTVLGPLLGYLGFKIELDGTKSFVPTSGEELLFPKRYSFLFATKAEAKDLQKDLLISLILSNLWSISEASNPLMEKIKKVIHSTLTTAKTNLSHRKKFLITREYEGEIVDDRGKYERFIKHTKTLEDNEVDKAVETLKTRIKSQRDWTYNLLERYYERFGNDIFVPDVIAGGRKIGISVNVVKQFLETGHVGKVEEMLKEIEEFSPPLCNFELLDRDRTRLHFLKPVKSYKVVIKRHEDSPYDKLMYPHVDAIIDYYYRDRQRLRADGKTRGMTRAVLEGYFEEAKYINSPEKAVRVSSILENANKLYKGEATAEDLKAFFYGFPDDLPERRIFWWYDESKFRVRFGFRDTVPDHLFKSDPYNPLIVEKDGSELEFSIPPLPGWFYLTVEVLDMNNVEWTPIKGKIFGGQWSATISKELDKEIGKLVEDLGVDYNEALELLLRTGLDNLPPPDEIGCEYRLYDEPEKCKACQNEVYCVEKKVFGKYYVDLDWQKKLELLKKFGDLKD